MQEIELINACKYYLIQLLQKVILNHNALMLLYSVSALDSGPKVAASYISLFTFGFGSDMRCAPHFRQH